MRTLGRFLVGVLAALGALALAAVVAGVLILRAADPVALDDPAQARPAPSPQQPGSTRLVADNLSADVTVPFETLQERAGPGVSLSDAGEGRIRVEAPVEALGRTWQASAVGDLSADGDTVVVHPTAAQIEGLPLLDGVLSAVARQAAGVRAQVPDLPRGVRLDAVTSTSDGVRAHVIGDGVPLPLP